jgi:hypothetical protein
MLNTRQNVTRTLILLMTMCSMLTLGVARANGFLSAGLGLVDTRFSFGATAWVVLDGSLDRGAVLLNPSLEFQTLPLALPEDVPIPFGPTLDVGFGATYWRGLYTAWHVGFKVHALIDLNDINRTRFAVGVPFGFFIIPIAVQLEPMIDTRGVVMLRFMVSWFFTAI